MTFFCYGSGAGPEPPDLDVVRIPRAISPGALRAGPHLAKPAADAALAWTFAREARSRGFDAALAHNVEAALAALLARPLTGVPVAYVAHTLFGEELDAFAPAPLAAAARAAGAVLDRATAAHVDGIAALTEAAAARLSAYARGPVEVLPPGLTPAPPPPAAEVRRACGRFEVEPGRFALYTGNVDDYQDLDVLAEAARDVPELPVVVATHGERLLPESGLRCAQVTPDEARALSFACGVAVLPRRRPGGFPIKLLNYMEAGCAILARSSIAEGLEHDRSAWLVPPGAGAAEFAAALRSLAPDPERIARLGREARRTLEVRHAWPSLARRTLAFLDGLRVSPGARAHRSR